MSLFLEIRMLPMKPLIRRISSSLASRSLLISVSVLLSIPALAAGTSKEKTFKSPQEAVDALVAAVKGGSTDGIVAVLGPKGRALASSGDRVADQAARERFQTAYDETHEIKQEDDARAVLIIGKNEFPFPIPRWPAGDFPNLSAKDTGLAKWTAANRPIAGTDVVLWYVFGIHHITRPEEWPIMPADVVSFWLKPFGFFDRNPALDVPPSQSPCCD